MTITKAQLEVAKAKANTLRYLINAKQKELDTLKERMDSYDNRLNNLLDLIKAAETAAAQAQ